MQRDEVNKVISELERINAEIERLKGNRLFLIESIPVGTHLGTNATLTVYPRQRGLRFSAKKARKFLGSSQIQSCMQEVMVAVRVVVKRRATPKHKGLFK